MENLLGRSIKFDFASITYLDFNCNKLQINFNVDSNNHEAICIIMEEVIFFKVSHFLGEGDTEPPFNVDVLLRIIANNDAQELLSQNGYDVIGQQIPDDHYHCFETDGEIVLIAISREIVLSK